MGRRTSDLFRQRSPDTALWLRFTKLNFILLNIILYYPYADMAARAASSTANSAPWWDTVTFLVSLLGYITLLSTR